MDSHFDWSDEKKQSVEFISGLINVLVASKSAGVSKFIYCSSLSVFEDNLENEISESTKPTPINHRGKTLLQGEEMCSHYNDTGVFQIVTIRCAEVYGSFNNEDINDSVCSKMVLEAINTGKITQIFEKRHNLIYLDDAVEAVYEISKNKTSGYYQFNGSINTENEIAQIIADKLSTNGIEIVEDIDIESCGKIEKTVTTENIKDISYKQKFSLEEGISQYIKILENIVKREISKEKRKNILNKNFLIPFLENILLLIIAHLLTVFTKDTIVGNSIDFYLLYVLLIAVIHGTLQSMIAVVLSAVSNFSIVIAEEGLLTLVSNYNNYLWVLQILIVGNIVALARDIYKRRIKEITDENMYNLEELANIKKINDSNVYVKNIYEKRLVNYHNSMAKIYDITSILDDLSPQMVIFQAVTVVQQIMETEHVSIYMAGNNSKYLRLMAASSKKASQMGKTICFDEKLPIYNNLSEKEIYRNKNLREDCPVLAGATYNEDKLEVIVMVWSLDFEHINLYQANLLAILCRLIEKSLSRAFKFMALTHNESYIEDTKILNKEAFLQILELYREGASRELLEFTLLRMPIKSEIGNDLFKKAELQIRTTDFMGMSDNNELLILLANSSKEDAQLVIKRFESNDLSVSIIE